MPSIWDCVCVCVLQMGLLSIFPVLVMRENATANYYFQTASLMDFGGKKRLPCFYVPCFTTFSCYMCDTHVRSEMNKRIESSFRKKNQQQKAPLLRTTELLDHGIKGAISLCQFSCS